MNPMSTDEKNQVLVSMIVGTHSSFRIVENTLFQAFTHAISGGEYQCPSTATIRRLLSSNVLMLQSKHLNNMVEGSKLSLSLDCWTSPFNQAFMGIVASYITKDWSLENTLIGFEHLDGPHTGAELAKVVFQCAVKNGIEKRIMAITTDNASNNSTLLASIQEMILELTKENGYFKNRVQHIPCFSHVIQLGLQALLGSIRLIPSNEELSKVWRPSDEPKKQAEGYTIVFTLAKVCFY